MASSYMEPGLTHALGCGFKSRGGPGMERPAASMARVRKTFHNFESNSEPCTWASNIRHGDATDVRVGLQCTHTHTHDFAVGLP